jgi:hypothetical protein
MQISRPLLGFSVERTKAAIDYLCTFKVMIADRLAEDPGSARRLPLEDPGQLEPR